MNGSISDKITLLNHTALESLDEANEFRIISSFTRTGIKILGADFGCAWYKPQEKKQFQLAYKSPTMPYTPATPRKTGINHKVLQSKTPILIPSILQAGYVKADSKRYMNSVAAVPMSYKNRTYGSLILCFRATRHFSQDDYNLAQALGNAAAQAITINRLYISLQDFKSSLDSTLDTILLFDAQTLKISYANAGALQHLGRTRKQLSSTAFVEIVDRFDEKTFRQLAQPLISGKIESRIFETSLVHETGSRVPVEIFLQYTSMPRQPPKFLAIARDITERKQWEKKIITVNRKLRDSLERIEQQQVRDEALLTSLGDGILAADNKGRIFLFNQQAEAMLGWRATEAIGKQWKDIWQECDARGNRIPDQERPITKAIVEGRKTVITSHHDFYLVCKDGSRIPAAITASPVVLNGQVQGAIGVFRDISLEKEIDRAKSEFVSLASHQLRTPTSIISWYIEMLEEESQLPKEQRDYLREISKANRRMIELVNTLLDVSRIEMGTFPNQPTDTNIIDMANSVAHELEPEIHKKHITLHRSYPGHPVMLHIDPRMLRIVLQNLLTNAVKYTPQGGMVTLQVGVNGATALITVKDTGYGIPRAVQHKIFTKMFRADNVVANEPDGTGLGLYIVKAVVDQYQGKVWFDSDENKGTHFFVALPVKQ